MFGIVVTENRCVNMGPEHTLPPLASALIAAVQYTDSKNSVIEWWVKSLYIEWWVKSL